ncbi:MAG: hypothetical protein ACPGWS_01165, partial [Solirubrobacterales bacterium]
MFRSPEHLQRSRAGFALALVACAVAFAGIPSGAAAASSPLDTQGMWIWYVSQAERGSVNRIAARAKRYKVKTVFVKSSDGSNWWKQFDQYIAPLKA